MSINLFHFFYERENDFWSFCDYMAKRHPEPFPYVKEDNDPFQGFDTVPRTSVGYIIKTSRADQNIYMKDRQPVIH